MGIAKIEGEKRGKKKKNCGNSSAEIDGEKKDKKKKLNRRGERERQSGL